MEISQKEAIKYKNNRVSARDDMSGKDIPKGLIVYLPQPTDKNYVVILNNHSGWKVAEDKTTYKYGRGVNFSSKITLIKEKI